MLKRMSLGLRWLLARVRLGRKRSAPVAEMPELWGAMAGSVRIAPGTDLTNVLKTATVCPTCHLRLGAADHAEAVGAVLKRLSQSVEQQLSRLSSVAVRAILERSNDPRVERFLKVVQAAQITTLTEILDDELVGYLRRFLLEARISTLLEPIFDHVQEGGADDEATTREALEKLADVLHRAIRGAGQTPGNDGEPAR